MNLASAAAQCHCTHIAFAATAPAALTSRTFAPRLHIAGRTACRASSVRRPCNAGRSWRTVTSSVSSSRASAATAASPTDSTHLAR